MRYLQISKTAPLPDITELKPFKAIIVVSEAVNPLRQAAISEWLIASGCLYAMAWGSHCNEWIASLHRANHEAFPNSAVPDASVVIVTAHDKEPINEVFWFAKHTAMHPCAQLDNTLLLHLNENEHEQEYCSAYLDA